MAADLYGEMQLEAHPPAKRRWRDYLPGVLVSAIAALAAAWLADHYAAPLVLMGLLIGLAMSFLSQDRRTHAGLDLMSQTALRIGSISSRRRISAIASAKAPTPGRTMRSARATISGSAVTAISAAPAAFSAFRTDWRLPAP